MSTYLLFSDKNLLPLGQPIADPIGYAASIRSQKPGTLQLQLPALPKYREWSAPGNRLTLIRDGRVEIDGPIEVPYQYSRSVGGGQDAAPGLLSISATDDMMWLALRQVYPDPAHVSTAQPTGTPAYIDSGVAETVLRDLFDTQVGEGAVAGRPVPHFKLGAANDPLVGGAVAVHARFDLLSDVMRAVALAGGVSYRIRRSGTDLLFEVYALVDKTGAVRFSDGLRNVTSLTYQESSPKGNVAIVGGDGAGDARTIVERVDSDSVTLWGRRELPFVSGPNSSDTDTLNQAGDNALVQGGGQATLAVQAIDTRTVRYGRDFGIDDLVSVEVWPGKNVPAQVIGVDITYDEQNGEKVVSQIGTPGATTDPILVRLLRDTIRNVGALERT